MAFSVAAVSSSVSPLFTEEVETDMLITSAPRRLPASSKLARVRVESSKNRLIRVRPRNEVALRLARAVEQHIALRQVEQMADLGRIQALDRQQVPVTEDESRFQCRGH